MTDITPTLFKPTPDAAPVRGVGAKSGNDGHESGDGGFRDLLKQIAGDKGEQKAADANATRGKDAAARGHARTLDSAKAALAELRGKQGKEARARDAGAKDADADDVAKTDEAGEGAPSAEEKATDAGASGSAVALLLSLAHKGTATTRAQTTAGQGGAGSPDSTLGGDAAAATAVADKAMREVHVVSVKVETHFAAVHTDAATTGFAQRLALSQIAGGGTQSGPTADGAKSKPDTKAGLEANAAAGTEKASDARPTRGQMFAARGDHRGADNPGAGTGKSAGDGKTAAAATGIAAAQRSTTPGVDASQVGVIATPMQQLSNRLLATAHELQQAASATPASSAGDASAASAPPIRVLSINLHPEELGSVTVRMSMVAGSLDVQIDAENSDTAQMLRTDSDQITDMLRSAGIQVDGITVRAASPDFVSTSGGSTGSFFDQQTQSQSGGAQSDGRGFGGQQRGDDASQSFGRGTSFGQDDESRNQRDRGTGLYV